MTAPFQHLGTEVVLQFLDGPAQGGLGDVAFLPAEASDSLGNRTIYLSWAEAGDGDTRGAVVGKVTSGGFSPTLSTAIAMGFVPPALSLVGTPLSVIVRGKSQPAQVVAMPFVPHRYVRKS